MFSKATSIVLLMSLSFSAFAQVKAPSESVSKPAQSILERAKAQANAALIAVKRNLALESDKTMGYDACKVVLYKIQKEYNQWFLDHYTQFESLSAEIDSVFLQANQKLNSLKKYEVWVVPFSNQTLQPGESEVPVSFEKLIEYFRIFNGRMQTCSKDSKSALIAQMNDPQMNRLHIAHDQVVAAMEIMKNNLNASLEESGTSYDLAFSPAECGYKLELRVEMDLNGIKQKYSFSLLGSDVQTKIKLGDNAKWSALSKAKIDGMPVDGLLRYRKIQEQLKGQCASLAKIPFHRVDLPFVQYSEIAAIAERLKKDGAQSIGQKIEFVTVKPGTFQMGSPSGEVYCSWDETQHSVTLTNAFEMQTTEVTQSQWFEVMGSNPSQFKSKTHCNDTWMDQNGGMCPSNPVEQVSWIMVQDFIQKLNAKNDGYTYRLPTEAEWEYAARGKTTTAFFNGDSDEGLKKVAWFDQNSGNHTHEVGTAGNREGSSANQYGLYDMYGNVWEWVQDWYGAYSSSSVINPVGATNGSSRVLRGGSWGSRVEVVRSALRYGVSPGVTDDSVGFRLVRTPR